MWVRDALGRDWRVELPFLPWRRVVKPFFFFTDEKLRMREFLSGMRVDTRTVAQRERAERVATLEAEKRDRENKVQTSGEKAAYTALGLLMIPFMLRDILGAGIVSLLLLPFAAVELLVRAVAGALLWLWRVWGWTPSRVIVYGCEDGIIRSLSVFDVPGRAAARRLAGEIATSLSVTSGPFVPGKVPEIRAAGAVRKRHASGW